MTDPGDGESERWEAICRVSDVPLNAARRFEVPGLPAVAVYHVGEEFYVTDDACTHLKASLSDGWVEGDVIECPLHGGRFHIPTGDVVSRPPRRPLTTYPARVGDDSVFIKTR